MKISRRLNLFIERNLRYEDIGGPEYGPQLESWYEGPDWAIELYEKTEDPNSYYMNVAYEWRCSNEHQSC